MLCFSYVWEVQGLVLSTLNSLMWPLDFHYKYSHYTSFEVLVLKVILRFIKFIVKSSFHFLSLISFSI